MQTSEKFTLRSQCLAARSALDAEYKREASVAIAPYLREAIGAAKMLAAYVPIRDELDILPALEGYALCLPVVIARGEPLQFRAWKAGDALERGEYGVSIPRTDAAVVVPDTVIVPLVAFDAQRHRLGYGAGYYDRTLAALRAKNKGVRAIGVGYSVQQVACIPAAAHDEILDAIVTEKGIL